jgi:hypothetical protein
VFGGPGRPTLFLTGTTTGLSLMAAGVSLSASPSSTVNRIAVGDVARRQPGYDGGVIRDTDSIRGIEFTANGDPVRAILVCKQFVWIGATHGRST